MTRKHPNNPDIANALRHMAQALDDGYADILNWSLSVDFDIYQAQQFNIDLTLIWRGGIDNPPPFGQPKQLGDANDSQRLLNPRSD